MPYGAFALTVTAPPVCPLLCDAPGVVLDGDGEELLAEPDPAAEPVPEVIAAGTDVTLVPSRTFTWPAATEELGLAVTPPKYPAIRRALPAAPAPYSTWVDDWTVILPTLPALYPAEVSARDNCPASPVV
jgi:hypothetical protein